MPIQPPQRTVSGSDGTSFEGPSSVSRQAKETVKRLRTYLRGRRSVDLESLVADSQTLSAREWCAALTERRNSGKIVYLEPASLEQCSQSREDPFQTVYGRELLSRLEAELPAEQLPYLDAFLAGEKPKEIAKRLGISAKAASARMRRFKAKIANLYATLRIG
jgi:DNA-directed RNA polymerase specialized sigma24 family protein